MRPDFPGNAGRSGGYPPRRNVQNDGLNADAMRQALPQYYDPSNQFAHPPSAFAGEAESGPCYGVDAYHAAM